MPIPIDSPPTNPLLESLLRASEVTPPRGSPGVAPCPLRSRHEHGEERQKKPIRLLFWHIFELGGGFYMPPARPQYAIDAIAALIAALDLHVVVLQGLARTIQEVPKAQGSGPTAYVSFEPEPQDTGPAEAARILKKLQALDGGAGWKLQLPKSPATGKCLYHRLTTAAFLYASGKGVNFQKLDLVESSVNEAAGATGTLLAARFDAPAYQSGPLYVMTPLGLGTPERPWERLRVPTPETERAPTAPMPDAAIVFVSAPGYDRARMEELEDELDGEFLRPTPEGTVLGDEFWKVVAETRDGLLGNFVAVNPGNIMLQDREMHWEALRAPEHPTDTHQLQGFLADSVTVVHHRTSPPPRVEELRVVDLIAASLSADAVASLRAGPAAPTANGEAPPEIAALVAQRRTYHSEALGGPEAEHEPVNELSECGYFSRTLSRHWPLLTQLMLEVE